jgi:hypothetical protein
MGNYWLVVVRPRQCAPGELCHMDTPFMRFNRRLYWTSVVLFIVAAGDVREPSGSQMDVRGRSTWVAAAIVIMLHAPIAASGHEPVFGAATPTLGKGGWQFDQPWMGQDMDGSHNPQILRSMIGVGLTERIQVSISLPVPLIDSGFVPAGA